MIICGINNQDEPLLRPALIDFTKTILRSSSSANMCRTLSIKTTSFSANGPKSKTAATIPSTAKFSLSASSTIELYRFATYLRQELYALFRQ